MVAEERRVTRRPRDRRQQIIASAARQFRDLGYHNVGITGIAEAVGITSGALYRHFAGKQVLLRAAVEDTLDQLQKVWSRPGAALDDLLDAMCALTTSGPQVGALWAREITHLPTQDQHDLRERLRSDIEPLRAAMAAARPELSADAVDVLLWTIVGIVSSPGFYTARLDPRALHARLLDTCRAVSATLVIAPDVPDGESLDPASLPDVLLPAARQEAILVAAARLFSVRGYQAVGVDDIGAAAGITGASVYHHFPNKAAILDAALNRGLQAMLLDLSGALDSSTTPGAALRRLLRYYVRMHIEHGRMMSTLQNEAINLPSEDRRVLVQKRADYVSEWVALLTRHRSDLPESEAQVLVMAATTAISTLLAIARIRRRPHIADELVSVGAVILGLDKHQTSPTGAPHA